MTKRIADSVLRILRVFASSWLKTCSGTLALLLLCGFTNTPATSELPTLRDIAPPVARMDSQPQNRWLFHFASLAVMATVALVLARRRRSQTAEERPAHETALAALDALDREKLEPVERIRALDRILRIYLHQRFELPALESTSRELIRQLDDPNLIDFLKTCDQIKFAGALAPAFPQEAETSLRHYFETCREEAPCD